MRSVRTNRYKYIRRFLTRQGSDNCDASVSRSLLRECGWDALPVPVESLFDLIFDPNEAANLAADPAYLDVLVGMRARLDRWMKDTQDPALTGKIEPKPGMLISSGDKDLPHGSSIPAETIVLSNL
jgi:hypothetical protein